MLFAKVCALAGYRREDLLARWAHGLPALVVRFSLVDGVEDASMRPRSFPSLGTWAAKVWVGYGMVERRIASDAGTQVGY